MRCDQVLDKLDSYLGCELSEIEEFHIRKHLSTCLRCKKECDDMQDLFFTLSIHDVDITPQDFTDSVLSQITVYEEDKTMKEVLIYKGLASVLAAGMISALFSFVQYRPVNLLSQIYRGSERINRIVVEPVDRLSREIKEIADSF